MRRARIAVSVVFFVNGLVLASWLPHIPAVKARHALGDAQLGLVLLAMAGGAVVALPLAGWLVGRLGSRPTTSAVALAFCATLPLPLVTTEVTALVVALVLFGGLNGTLDVSMNTHAAALERHVRRPIMSSLHALFSLGALAGAGLASALMAVGVGDRIHVVAVALTCVTVLVAVLPWLSPDAPGGEGGPVLAAPSRAMFRLGLLGFLGLLIEGAMGDWSAVYIHDALGQRASVAAIGFAAFSLAMAVGRLGGDRLVSRLGPGVVVRSSSAVAAAGLTGALVVAHPVAAIVGFGLVGLGVANVVPLLFGAAARIPGLPPGHGLAAVATAAYVGYLAGPPLIGLAAELAGLPVALGVVSVCCAVTALWPWPAEPPTPERR